MTKDRTQKTGSMKIIALVMAMALMVGCGIGGTLAWLLDSTGTVTNTFAIGDIDIEISENGATKDGDNWKKDTYQILPGTSESKDPKVTVKAGSEACWVFVEIIETNNRIPNDEGGYTEEKYITWEGNLKEAGPWTRLGTPAVSENGDIITYVYYLEQAAIAEGADPDEYYVLKGDTTYTNGVVSYSKELTKEDLAKLGTGNVPSLTFKAYAIQSEALTITKNGTESPVTDAADAWALAKPDTD